MTEEPSKTMTKDENTKGVYVVVPAYNEEKRIIETLKKAQDYFNQK